MRPAAATLRAVGLLAALALGSGACGSGSRGAVSATTSAPPPSTIPGACQADDLSDPGNAHVAAPAYTVNPPAGGDHLPIPAPAGVYASSDVPPDGQLVHSLEHGYVILWFRPDLSAQEYAALVAVAERRPADVLVVPRPSLPVPVAATAWHHRLLCNQLDPGALAAFVDRWRNQGPERIPH